MTASSGLWFQVFMAWPPVPLETNTFVSRNLLWFYTLYLSICSCCFHTDHAITFVSSFGKDIVVLSLVFFLRRCASKLDQRLTDNVSLDP